MKILKETISKMDVDNERYMNMIYWRNRVALNLQLAAENGVVITVDNPPNWPPAMGNYDLVVSARPMRGKLMGVCLTCAGKGGFVESGCGEGCCPVSVMCDACQGAGEVAI